MPTKNHPSASTRPPHSATLPRRGGVQPKAAEDQRPPHPATVVQPRAKHPAMVPESGRLPHAATVAQPKVPHPATAVQGRGRPPHAATVAQPKASHAATVQRSAVPPHPATVMQRRVPHPASPGSTALQRGGSIQRAEVGAQAGEDQAGEDQAKLGAMLHNLGEVKQEQIKVVCDDFRVAVWGEKGAEAGVMYYAPKALAALGAEYKAMVQWCFLRRLKFEFGGPALKEIPKPARAFIAWCKEGKGLDPAILYSQTDVNKKFADADVGQPGWLRAQDLKEMAPKLREGYKELSPTLRLRISLLGKSWVYLNNRGALLHAWAGVAPIRIVPVPPDTMNADEKDRKAVDAILTLTFGGAEEKLRDGDGAPPPLA